MPVAIDWPVVGHLIIIAPMALSEAPGFGAVLDMLACQPRRADVTHQ
jgi:hypothetical protein